MTADVTVCRCEEVYLADLRQAIDEGFTTPQALKLLTRAGMGLCGGRTCRSAIESLLTESGHPPDGRSPLTFRAPARPIKLAALAQSGKGEAL